MRADLNSARRLGLAILAAALMLPSMAQADPAASGPAAQPPLTVPVPDGPDPAPRREANRERMRAARLEQLHKGLQLATTQEPMWPPVADAIHGFDQARGRRFRQQLEAVADANAALKMQGDHMAKVGAALSQLADATKPLLASLTAEQKSRLPTLLQRAPFRKVLARAFGVRDEAAAPPPLQASPPPGAAMPDTKAGDAAAPGQPRPAPDDDDND